MSLPTFAILAEDDSDAEALAHLVRRHFNNEKLSVKKKGYDGCGGLCAKGARDIRTWLTQGTASLFSNNFQRRGCQAPSLRGGCKEMSFLQRFY